MQERKIRTIWISDCHLGCQHSHSDKLLQFLKHKNPVYLYINGDFLDGWRLKRKWYWSNDYNLIVRRILGMVKKGTKVFYVVGNHDEFFRNIMDFANEFGNIHFTNEVIHETVDGKKLLVIHGDKFDTVIRHVKWLAFLGDIGYDILIQINRLLNNTRRLLGLEYWSLSKLVKQKVKEAANFISSFETILCDYAKKQGCDGVVAGHIHTPADKIISGMRYYNCGDWLENATAIIEYEDGEIELIDYLNLSSRS